MHRSALTAAMLAATGLAAAANAQTAPDIATSPAAQTALACAKASGVPQDRVLLRVEDRGVLLTQGGVDSETAPIVTACRAARDADPAQARRSWMLGLALFEAQKLDEADEAFGKARELLSPGGYIDGARLALRRGDQPRAVAIAREGALMFEEPEMKRVLAQALAADGPARDRAAAAKTLEEAQGYGPALADLAMLTFEGVERGKGDASIARGLFYRAAATGSAYASRRFAEFLRASDASLDEVDETLSQALSRGDGPAGQRVAAIYLDEKGKSKTWPHPDAGTLFRAAAAAGDPEAQDRLASIHYNASGRGERGTMADRLENDRLALHWATLAFNRGSACGGDMIGLIHDHGRGVPLDYKTSFEWFTKSADAGCPGAISNLGFAWLNGRGVPRDPGKAVAAFERAAAMGDPAGMTNLAGILQRGVNAPKDATRAFGLLKRAADQGFSTAINNLAFAYMRGVGVAPDLKEARRQFQRAADRGSSQGMHNLAGMCEAAQGGERDLACAHQWFRRAAMHGGMPNSLYRYAMRLKRDGCDAQDRMPGGEAIAQEACPAAARAWLTRAVDAGDPHGRDDLVEMLLEGEGGPNDPQRALAMLREDATTPARRLAYAQALLDARVGGHRDAEKAREILPSLVDEEDEGADAALTLARMMAWGEGGRRDLAGAMAVLARRWEAHEERDVGMRYAGLLRESKAKADRAKARDVFVAIGRQARGDVLVPAMNLAGGDGADKAAARSLLEERAATGRLDAPGWGRLSEWRGAGLGGRRDARGQIEAAMEADGASDLPVHMPLALALAARPGKAARDAAAVLIAEALSNRFEGTGALRAAFGAREGDRPEVALPAATLNALAARLAAAYEAPPPRRWDATSLDRARRVGLGDLYGSGLPRPDDMRAATRLSAQAKADRAGVDALVRQLLGEGATRGGGAARGDGNPVRR